jgi:hypothetical protein
VEGSTVPTTTRDTPTIAHPAKCLDKRTAARRRRRLSNQWQHAHRQYAAAVARLRQLAALAARLEEEVSA